MRPFRNLRPLGALILAAAFACAPSMPQAAAQTAQNESVLLFESKPYVAPSVAEQTFEDNLTLRRNQEQLPLILTIYNGPNGKTPFNWFRLNIAGYLMASEKDMNGKRSAAIDVTGKMQPGGGQIIMTAAGEPGASLVFTLSTVPVWLTAVEPPAVQAGKTIVLQGDNFSSDENQNTVIVNGKEARILSSSKTSITAQVPPDAPAGEGSVRVIVDSVESKTLPIQVSNRVAPMLLGTDFWMAPPGATLQITGQNFAANPANNKVYFGKVAAQVVSGSTNTLNVVIPNWGYGAQQLNIPVWVSSDGVRSANSIPFDIGPKYLGATPPFPGDSYSEASSQATSQATSEASSQATSQASSQANVTNYSEAGTQSYQEGPGIQLVPVK